MLLSGNSVMDVISWKNMPIFTEIILLLIKQNTIPYGQRHYQSGGAQLSRDIQNEPCHTSVTLFCLKETECK